MLRKIIKFGKRLQYLLGSYAASSIGLIYLPVALACVATLYVIFNIVPIRELYDQIEWPVVVSIGFNDSSWERLYKIQVVQN